MVDAKIQGVIFEIPKLKDTGKFRFFAFIQGDDSQKYFLHASDFSGHWFNDLCKPFAAKEAVRVEFKGIMSDKGLRATDCQKVTNANHVSVLS